MEKLGRITTDPARVSGEPSSGTSVLPSAEYLKQLAIYPDRADVKREYPDLVDEDARQALAFAAA
jgi:uncharacterized protein (DUF433 family)